MQNFSRLLFFLFLIGSTIISAQKSASYTHDSKDFEKAVSLYNEAQYNSAQLIFEKVKLASTNEEIKSDCSFYSASCAFQTNQNNADKSMERFIADYPTSIKQNQAFMEIAHYFFVLENYPQAIKWYEKVDEGNLNTSIQEKYYFEKAYSLFNSNNKKEAKTNFDKVLNSDKFGLQAKYYLGFMAYEGNDYKQAEKYFEAVSNEEKYAEKLSYYQADMNFNLGNFEKAIDLGVTAMDKSNDLEKSELNKIIGESYFNLKQYQKSIPFLELYRGKNEKWNNTDFYQLGFAYYKQKEFAKAISQFNKIIGGKDFIAQNAYYHLGESYLNLDKKQEALNAFKNASEMEFNTSLQEDASLNYAKLSYEIGNSYQDVPSILTSFIKKYPNSSSKNTIEKLLIDSYISSKNYKEALILIENNKTSENKLAYQKVTFYRGLELFADGNFQEASALFNASIEEQKDIVFSARATFWKAETEYVLGDFKNALLSYKQFISMVGAKESPEFEKSNYAIGYAYFKLKEYEQAGDYFENQIQKSKSDKVRLHDSYLRLGDCRFVTSKYGAALEAYNKGIELKSVDADYAYFQKAICYGFLSKNSQKIEELNSFLRLYPDSEYRDDVLFELANTYVIVDKQDLALKTYDRLNTEFKKSSYTSKAILRQGLVYYNSDKEEQALIKFKKVAADFPKTPEALEAVATARLIYVNTAKVDEYAAWVRTLDFVAVTDAELDNDTFEGAEKHYLQNNSKLAITGLSGYISKFPKGIHALKANFYLAQSYFSEEQENASIPNYEFVINEPQNEFTEQSLLRLAQIFLKTNDFDKAIPVLLRLENEADLYQNKVFGQSNLMQCYYNKADSQNAVAYAEKVLANPKTDADVKVDAQLIIARLAITAGDEVKARLAYAKLQSIAKGELAAEVLYYDAYFKNKDAKFEESNTVIQSLAKDYSSYKFFGAKGLVLMAKNFYGLKDSFQATYILENVIKNFTDFPELVSQAQSELDFINTEESKTNASIINLKK